MTWHHRGRLSTKEMPEPNPKRRSSLILGASIIVVELPTAFPYFAAIAAIVGSGVALTGQIAMLGVYNVCFVLPLLAMFATLIATGDRAQRIFENWREKLRMRWPAALPSLLLVGATLVTTLAFVGLASS